MGEPGPQGPPGPPGEGALLTGKGVSVIGPPGEKGEHGEKVGVDRDDDFFLFFQIILQFCFLQTFTVRRSEVALDTVTLCMSIFSVMYPHANFVIGSLQISV